MGISTILVATQERNHQKGIFFVFENHFLPFPAYKDSDARIRIQVLAIQHFAAGWKFSIEILVRDVKLGVTLKTEFRFWEESKSKASFRMSDFQDPDARRSSIFSQFYWNAEIAKKKAYDWELLGRDRVFSWAGVSVWMSKQFKIIWTTLIIPSIMSLMQIKTSVFQRNCLLRLQRSESELLITKKVSIFEQFFLQTSMENINCATLKTELEVWDESKVIPLSEICVFSITILLQGRKKNLVLVLRFSKWMKQLVVKWTGETRTVVSVAKCWKWSLVKTIGTIFHFYFIRIWWQSLN